MHDDFPPGLVLVRDLAARGIDEQELRRAANRGAAKRLRRGVYYNGDWEALSPDAQYRLLCVGVARSRQKSSLMSHESAASLWRIPTLSTSRSSTVHVTISAATGGRSRNGIRRHVGKVPEASRARIDDIDVTTITRTIVDLAASASFRSAVIAADFAVHEGHAMVTLDELWSEFELMKPFSNMRRAKRVLDFASTQSGSPGESLSRAVMHELGFPAPVLQERFRGITGRVMYADFFWPEYSLVGEFDGRGKYEKQEYLNGMTPQERLWDEKKRQDDLNRQVRRVERWGWHEAMHPARLSALLVDAGLPRRGVRPSG
ncbi:MAG TPA: type IV toxin-antitoxin system AbiEi family antitoxin domain-containing protein [Terrimesophilobacter sp.]|nr:type IV toxin-antitoxin system AbiEi family antitoxin domain-containing protein [Terrimesophilobacter sp.]